MSIFASYLSEIQKRKKLGLHPKPIDNGNLTNEIIQIIKDKNSNYRNESIQFLFTIYFQVQQMLLK